jgi:cysteinyl-tRNA synthetase
MKKFYMCTIILITGILVSCPPSDGLDRDFRQDMRDFVQAISAWVKATESVFIIIPQNGHDLVTENGESSGNPAMAYLDAIDGLGREDLFYGYDEDDIATPASERDEMIAFLDIAKNHDVEVLVTDYCSTEGNIDDSYTQNDAHGYLSFAADHRELDDIPPYPPPPPHPNNEHTIQSWPYARNFLYLLNNSKYYANKAAFLTDLQNTTYDLIIMDLYFDGTALFGSDDIASLKTKAGDTGTRLVIAYMSIGEAEDYRPYWKSSWVNDPPDWLEGENPEWEGNYKVRYWESGWQEIIFGNDDSYLKKIMDAGFDGVYLDIIDAFEYFEDTY